MRPVGKRAMPAYDLHILQDKHGLPPLDGMDVAVLRSKASRQSAAVDAMYQQVLQTLLPRV